MHFYNQISKWFIKIELLKYHVVTLYTSKTIVIVMGAWIETIDVIIFHD